jgi:hypothetical protein
MLPSTMPAIAPEERAAEFDDEIGDVVGLAVDVAISEGYPWPGLNMRVEFLA